MHPSIPLPVSPLTPPASPPCAGAALLREQARLRAVQRMALSGARVTVPGFQHIAELAARLLDAPIALFSVLDEEQQWFCARVGLTITGTPRAVSFCAEVVATRAPVCVPDTLADARYRDNPLVTGAPHIRSYLGTPVRTYDDQVIGALCVIDTEPRVFGEPARRDLANLALLLEELIHARELARSINRGARPEPLGG